MTNIEMLAVSPYTDRILAAVQRKDCADPLYQILQDYARAVAEHNVSERDAQIAQLEKANEQLHAHGERMHAEIERLRQDVGTATRTHAITREHLEAAEARAERLLAEREVIAAEAVKYADKSGRLEAEIEALRAEVDRWKSSYNAAIELKGRAFAEGGRLAGLLDEVRSCFTHDDDLPNGLLPRIDAALRKHDQEDEK